MAASQTSSRLQLLQARFQQRQLQEKEQKLIQLYDQQQQRAHQVALRGSAGSGDSLGSSHGSIVTSPAGKVRQMFDERRQNKGIDKSYPLDPLDSRLHKQAASNRRSLGMKRTTKTDAGVGSRDSYSRESNTYSSIRSAASKESSIHRENNSRDSEASTRSSETNGHAVNIDEVIHNEPRKSKLQDVPDASPASRKTSQVVERTKNSSLRKMNGIGGGGGGGLKKLAGIPTGGGVRQSTLMNTTKSTSLKIRKLTRNRKALQHKKAPSQVRKKSSSSKKRECSCDREKKLSDLKSTSLVREVIQNRSNNIRPSEASLISGKVKTIVTKMESIATEIKKRTASISSKFTNDPESTKPAKEINEGGGGGEQSGESSKRPSIIDSDECKENKSKEAAKAYPDKSEEAKSVEGKGDEQAMEGKSDWLISQQDTNASASRGRQREGRREIADRVDDDSTRDYPPRASGGYSTTNRPRRSSFELKRSMFEQNPKRLPARRDSVESALRHFDSIEANAKEEPADEPGKKGFERHTRSWLMKTNKEKETKKKRKTTKAVKERIAPKKKVAEARDSIELVKKTQTRSKSIDDSDDNEATVVICQSFLLRDLNNRAVSLKSIISNEPFPKIETFSISTTKILQSSPEYKKTDATKKSPFAKSIAEDALEKKIQAPVKSTSLKFLNHILGEPTALSFDSEPPRKSSVFEINSPAPLIKDEKPSAPMMTRAAVHSRGSLSQSSNAEANRNCDAVTTTTTGNVSRTVNKAKSMNATSTTPTHKTPSTGKTATTDSDLSLITCKICNRRFATDRIDYHVNVCAKSQKKRKQFDVVTQRVRGTDLESFVKTPLTKKQSKVPSKSVEVTTSPPKSNWRRKHEEFINAIRSAKQVQAHLDAGGKLSDLPPPPPSDTSDYIQCPKCSRRFSESAAKRHIPKCNPHQHTKGAASSRFSVKSKR